MAWLEENTKRFLKHLLNNYLVVVVIFGVGAVLDWFEHFCREQWHLSNFACVVIGVVSRTLFTADAIAVTAITLYALYRWFRDDDTH